MGNTLDLEVLELAAGGHSAPEDGMCVMEAVAFVAGEKFSDHPTCASPVLGSFLRSWNDSLDDADRQMLKPFIPRLVGTNTGLADEETRAWMLTDWLARECAPAWLRLAGLTNQAELLEQLAPLTGSDSALSAQPSLDAARAAGAAAWDAAWDAAWAAAWDAARAAAGDAAWAAAGAAAWDAARAAAGAAAGDAARDAAGDAAGAAAWAAARAAAGDAARDAAGDAARDAARAAAWDAAWAAARDALAPTTKGLQASALLLLERLIEVGKVEVEA
jgi:hypothetical protein